MLALLGIPSWHAPSSHGRCVLRSPTQPVHSLDPARLGSKAPEPECYCRLMLAACCLLLPLLLLLPPLPAPAAKGSAEEREKKKRRQAGASQAGTGLGGWNTQTPSIHTHEPAVCLSTFSSSPILSSLHRPPTYISRSSVLLLLQLVPTNACVERIPPPAVGLLYFACAVSARIALIFHPALLVVPGPCHPASHRRSWSLPSDCSAPSYLA
ncbi:hypothetical protein F4808DRAFT_320697 [Astrocystis sublimbata]|nr:hypothetical protein F4808DRAFT_320697 [Astrocystis sublimbata]